MEVGEKEQQTTTTNNSKQKQTSQQNKTKQKTLAQALKPYDVLFVLLPKLSREVCWAWFPLFLYLYHIFYQWSWFFYICEYLPSVGPVREICGDLNTHLTAISEAHTYWVINPRSLSYRQSTSAKAFKTFQRQSYFSITGTTHHSLSFSPPPHPLPPNPLPLLFYFLYFLKQGLNMQPKLVLDLWSPSLNLPSPRIASMHIHAQC